MNIILLVIAGGLAAMIIAGGAAGMVDIHPSAAIIGIAALLGGGAVYAADKSGFLAPLLTASSVHIPAPGGPDMKVGLPNF